MAAIEENKDSKAAEGVAGAEVKTPADAPTKPDVQAKDKAEAKPDAAAAKAEKDGKPGKGDDKPRTLKDDEEIPDDDALIALSPSALKKRLQRATNSELKERFGTSDTEVIKKKLARADELEKAEEERRLAALDEKARLEEKAKKAEERAEVAERRARELGENQLVEKEEGRLKDLAANYTKPKFWKHVARDLAEHLRDNFTAEQLKTLKDKSIEKWLADYVKENPEYAKDDKKPEPKKEPIDNGANDQERPGTKAALDLGKKTFKPGLPNSMTTAEARAEAAKQGHRW